MNKQSRIVFWISRNWKHVSIILCDETQIRPLNNFIFQTLVSITYRLEINYSATMGYLDRVEVRF